MTGLAIISGILYSCFAIAMNKFGAIHWSIMGVLQGSQMLMAGVGLLLLTSVDIEATFSLITPLTIVAIVSLGTMQAGPFTREEVLHWSSNRQPQMRTGAGWAGAEANNRKNAEE